MAFLVISTIGYLLPDLETRGSDYPVTQRQAPEEENSLASFCSLIDLRNRLKLL